MGPERLRAGQLPKKALSPETCDGEVLLGLATARCIGDLRYLFARFATPGRPSAPIVVHEIVRILAWWTLGEASASGAGDHLSTALVAAVGLGNSGRVLNTFRRWRSIRSFEIGSRRLFAPIGRACYPVLTMMFLALDRGERLTAVATSPGWR